MADHNKKPEHVCIFTIIDPVQKIAMCQMCGKIYCGT